MSDDAAPSAFPEADPPNEFDTYTLVFLTRPRDAPQLDEQESARLQRQHLDHLAMLRDQGAIAASGPFDQQWDESLRGRCVYLVGPEAARRLAEQDPAVRRGRLAIRTLRWHTRKGAVAFPPPS